MKNVTKKADVKETMDAIKVLGRPLDKTNFWFYVYGDHKTIFHAEKGNDTSLPPEDEKEGYRDCICYDVFCGDISYEMIRAYIEGDGKMLEGCMSECGQIMLHGLYQNLTSKQICCKVLKMAGYSHSESLVIRILSEKCIDDTFPKKDEEENSDSLARQTCIAIWYKTKGNMKKAMEILKNKIPLDPGYVKAVAREEKHAVADMGGILHVVVDEDFPEELKKRGSVSLCYIEKEGCYSPFPVFCGIK